LIHLVGQYPITLAAQFLHSSSDRRKIICRAGSGRLAQFLHSSSDRREIVCRARLVHVLLLLLASCRQFAATPGARYVTTSADDRADLAEGACFNDTRVEVSPV
jgi:hypothetical protein